MASPISEERKQQWKKNILEQLDSGLSIAAWCRQRKIAVHTFYYWHNKLFPKATFDKFTFTEIVNEKKLNTSDSGSMHEYQGINIHLSHDFESSTLKKCLEVLKEC